MNERNQAVVLMLLSALSFSLMQAVVKLSATNIGTMEQVFCRNLISMAISFVLLQRSHLPLLGGRKYQPALLARSFFGFIGVVMLFYATAGARQADIAVLNRTSPVWVSLFALLILRERISKVQIPVILLCLAGAVAAMRPSFDSNTLPLVLALLTAVSSGLALYHDRLLPRPGESHDRDLPLLPVQYHCRRSFDDSQFCGPHPPGSHDADSHRHLRCRRPDRPDLCLSKRPQWRK